MGNKFLSLLILIVLTVQPVIAQTLIPATSEDISEFDRQIANQLKRSGGRKADQKASKSSFGSQVSEEAKKLKDSDQAKDFGKWVSGQRKKSDQGRPTADGGNGTGKSSSAPGQSATQPGKGKNKNR